MSLPFTSLSEPKKDSFFNWKNLAIVGGTAIISGGLVYYILSAQPKPAPNYENVFTDVGIPNTRPELEALLIARGYSQAMITQLAPATIWELQCIVAAHLVGEKFAMPVI